MSSDAELLQQSMAGDRDAFASLVERYQNLICAVTFSGTADRELAADLAQDAFVAAWTSLPTLRDPARFRGWLCGIARNLVGKARRSAGKVAGPPDAELPDARPTAADALEDLQTQSLLRAILDEMDEASREPLVLFYWEGHSTKEVAAQLGLSVSAVEQRLSRGRRRIKAEVEARLDDALRAAKPDRRFPAAVLAAIEVLPGPTPPTATGRAAKALFATAGVTAISLGLWAFSAARSDPAAEVRTPGVAVALAREDAPTQARARPPEPRPARTSAVSPPQAENEDASEADDTTPLEIAAPLTLERFPNHVVVRLRGGPSTMTDASRQKLREGAAIPRSKDGPVTDRPMRTITGVVLGPEGSPVPGAAVVAGRNLSTGHVYGGEDELSGQAGAVCDDRGRFSFEATTEGLLLTAVASPHGFATPQAIEPGTAEVELEVALGGTSTLEGDLSFDGEPIPGFVTLRLSGPNDAGLQTQLATDEGGHYRTSLVPPGAYRVYAAANVDGLAGWEGGQGPNAAAEVELPVSGVAHRDFDFERGLTLEFRATTPGRLAYYAFPGLEVTSWADAQERLSDEAAQSAVVGSTPDDEDAFGVIHGVPATAMTVCAVRPHPLFEPTSYAECKVLPAPTSDEATISVTFDPPPVP